jgi:hypothetical protein
MDLESAEMRVARAAAMDLESAEMRVVTSDI